MEVETQIVFQADLISVEGGLQSLCSLQIKRWTEHFQVTNLRMSFTAAPQCDLAMTLPEEHCHQLKGR